MTLKEIAVAVGLTLGIVLAAQGLYGGECSAGLCRLITGHERPAAPALDPNDDNYLEGLDRALEHDK